MTSMIYALRVCLCMSAASLILVYTGLPIISPTGSPFAPTAVTVSDITSTSARISWTIPNIPSTVESYSVTYGLDPTALTSVSPPHNSGFNVYSQVLAGLDPSETYYFRVVASNTVGSSGSDIDSFMTLGGRKCITLYVALLTHKNYASLKYALSQHQVDHH